MTSGIIIGVVLTLAVEGLVLYAWKKLHPKA